MPNSSFEENWNALSVFLNKYYYKPDIEGLRIVLCTYLSHFYRTSPPVWLSVIGLPGSGKTELAINPLVPLNEVISESTLTVNSFLSGYGEKLGILPKLDAQYGGNGVLLFPDLTTTLLSEDPFTRAKIMGIMRRIYDGQYDKQVGNKEKKLEWKGKVTCIAACTPDIEDHWATYRDMGERWLQLRWGDYNLSYRHTKEMAEKAKLHEGHEVKISNQLKSFIAGFVNDSTGGSEEIPNSEQLTALAVLVEEMRVIPKREFVGKGYEVTGKGNKQSVTRTIKSLTSICKASTALRGSDKIEEIDIHLAKRVALDSIPLKRKIILDTLIKLYPDTIKKNELSMICKFPKSSFDRILEDLRFLDVIDVTDYSSKDLMDEDDEDIISTVNTPYGYVRPKKDAKIALNPMIIEILLDCKLLLPLAKSNQPFSS